MPTTAEPSSQTVHLPAKLAEVFQALRKGRHLCRTDGPAWFDVREYIDDYRVVFKALGYTLSDHARGFYYFSDGQQGRPDVLSRIVYFFACLFADLDQGRVELGQGRWIDALIDHDFDVPSLTQSMFAASDRQRVFDQLGVTRDGFENAVISPLLRYGIATRRDSVRLRFRESVYRFVELFQVCGDDNTPTVPAAPSPTIDEVSNIDDYEDDEKGVQ